MKQSKKTRNNRMADLQRRFEALKKPNNTNNTFVVDSLEDIGNKSGALLARHEYFNKQKKQKKTDIDMELYLRNLIDDYESLIGSCEIYSDKKQIKNLMESLLKNLMDLKDNDLKRYTTTVTRVPTMEELQKRFRSLSRFADSIREKRKKKSKKK